MNKFIQNMESHKKELEEAYKKNTEKIEFEKSIYENKDVEEALEYFETAEARCDEAAAPWLYNSLKLLYKKFQWQKKQIEKLEKRNDDLEERLYDEGTDQFCSTDC